MSFELKELSLSDFEATRSIYNYYITNTNATPQRTENTPEQHERIIGDFLSAYVARGAGQVLGFAFAKPYAKGLECFDPAVEIGVYMHPGSLRRGGGSELTRKVLNRIKLIRKHTAIAKIDAANIPSIAFFAKVGFEQAACLREIGLKREVRVTVIYMQLMLSSWNGNRWPAADHQ